MANKQDQTVLELLARWVRLLSVDQVGTLLSDRAGSRARARRFIVRLERDGLLERRTVLARLPVPVSPLLVYRAGDVPPDMKATSALCRARWKEPAGRVEVVQLSAAGSKAFGAPPPRRIRVSETTHDLQMAEVALQFWSKGQVKSWLRDDGLGNSRRWGKTVPDAEAVLMSGTRLVIECGGTYSAAKLGAFHEAIAPRMQELGVDAYHVY